MELSKALRKELRQLQGLGYERMLAGELTKLESRFTAWRSGELDAFELSEEIHVFHNGAARELYNRFGEHSLADILVARLLFDGVISESEVSPQLLEALAGRIEWIREHMEEADL